MEKLLIHVDIPAIITAIPVRTNTDVEISVKGCCSVDMYAANSVTEIQNVSPAATNAKQLASIPHVESLVANWYVCILHVSSIM